MSGNLISLAAEALVAVLLVITIVYCMVLNSRLKRLRADESDLRATITELVTATEIAERAIGGLKTAAVDCDKTLTNRMREAEHYSIEIAREIAEGHKILERIRQIASTVRKSEADFPKPVTDVPSARSAPPLVADVKVEIGKSDVRKTAVPLNEPVILKPEFAVAPVVKEAFSKDNKIDEISSSVAPSRSAGRIEELRAMAEQARERLKELRKVNTERAA